MSNQYSPADEGKLLREELSDGKKYIFERPLFIITLSIAGVNLIENSLVVALIPLAVGLLLFNLWFTVNRARSMGRIVAYIQLELEEQRFTPWLGWETSLRYFRIWIKENKSKVKEIIASNLDKDSPSAAGYYPPIYAMHVIAIIVAFAGSILIATGKPDALNIICASITILVTFIFANYAIQNRPSKLKFYIEENRILWIEVFKYLKELGIKKKGS